jgi:hypothetical protein
MKRRDFLSAAASAGVTATVLPRFAKGATSQVLPCPPPTVSVGSGPAVTTACTAPAPGAAPSWWTNLADGTWTAIANSGAGRLSQVVPNPNPIVGALGGDATNLCSDWCGASVNQDTGEYMFVSHGGHSSWAGNEAYVLNVRAQSPGWVRITDPTPVTGSSQWVPAGSALGNTSAWPSGFKGRWLDGRPTSTHCSGEAYANGRVWFPMANSYSNEAGDGTNLLYTFNLNYGPLVAARQAGSPLAWTSANLGPWEIWGQVNNPDGTAVDTGAGSGLFTFGISTVDQATGDVWYWGGKGEAYPCAYQIHTTGVSGAAPPTYKVWRFPANGYAGGFRTWGIIAHDLRLAVLGNAYDQTIYTLDLTNPAAGLVHVTNTSGTGYWGAYQQYIQYSYAGGAYVAANQSIAIGDPINIGHTIYKLKIPTKVSGGKTVYNPSGQWVWTTINGGGTGPDGVTGGNTYTRWNTIMNMGDGRQAIIVCSDVNAVHVYKVPAAGI